MKGLPIETVVPGSIAREMGVEAGDLLLAVNGHPLRDIIDYTYYCSGDDELLLLVSKPDHELWELEIQREPGQPLGLIFEAPKPSRCRNNCVFCFVSQLPRGLRRQLYVRDEDYRLSFLNGSYVTLADLKPSEFRRIVGQRLSPLYISVHCTNPQLREKLLGRTGIPPILEQLRRLAAARIDLHTQVVLCPGLNDGPELERTVADLSALHPAIRSLAVVPLGLTAHRANLPQLTPVDREYSRVFVSIWEPRARELNRRLGEPFLFLADEFYLKASLPFPPLRTYGDLPQIENGVGMVPLFLRDAARTVRSARKLADCRVTVVTGVSSFGFVSDFLKRLGEKTGVDIMTVAVVNRLFGDSVTVSGLVAGEDIIAELSGRETGEALLVPDVMLKEGEGIFLDDLSLEELGRRLHCRVAAFDPTPRGFYRAIRALSNRRRKT